jgi:hypothetical protein
MQNREKQIALGLIESLDEVRMPIKCCYFEFFQTAYRGREPLMGLSFVVLKG